MGGKLHQGGCWHSTARRRQWRPASQGGVFERISFKGLPPVLPSGLLKEKCFHPQGTTEPGHAFPSGVEESSAKAVLPPTPHCATPRRFQLTQHPFNLLQQSFSQHTDAFWVGVGKEGWALGTTPFAAHHLSTGTGHY